MEFEARDIIFKSGDTMQLMDIMEKMELLESIFIKLIMILILILKPIDLHILQKILMIQLYWVEQMIQQILDQSNNMNDIVTEIKLEALAVEQFLENEVLEKVHIYGLDMVRTEIKVIQANQELMDHLHLYYIYLLVLKL